MLNFSEIHSQMLAVANQSRVMKMTTYMRNQFEFLGVAAPERKIIQKGFFKEVKNQPIDWGFVEKCWEAQYREFQYVAKDYLVLMKKKITPYDIEKLKNLVIKKSWWDSVDGLDIIIGFVALSFPEVEKILLKWSVSEDIWLRRVTINHQLLRKEKTNLALLSEVIKNNFGTDEFFINKAIGWALRDFAKTNPEWVKAFISENRAKMSALSIKEASKYLK